MSELHKKLIHKQRGSAFGLEPLPEGLLSDLQTTRSSQTPIENNDDSIFSFYSESKNRTFPIQDVFMSSDGTKFQTYYAPSESSTAPTLIFHHGAGSSSMTFCWLVRFLKGDTPEETPNIFLFDVRGHGHSSLPTPVDFGLLTLTADFSFVINEFCSRHKSDTAIFLIGHSLGGAVLTNFISNCDYSPYNIQGLAMVDIVEETAVRALLSMSSFVKKRPESFLSYAEAIQWHLHSQLLRNEQSAKISVCDLLKRDKNGYLVWKTELSTMSPDWDSWFVNLSDKFITCDRNSKQKIAKLLILSGNDILDKNLIIGQMQGKYQLIVFNNSSDAGHFLQEDIPKQLGISIMEFVRRNDAIHQLASIQAMATKWGGKVNH